MRRLIFLLFLVLSSTFALQISLDPPRYELKLAPGATVRKTLTLSNTGKDTVKVNVYLSDWYLAEGKKSFLPAGATRYSLKDYCKIFPSSFVLKPKENKQVLFTVSAAKTEQSGRYGVIFFEAFPNVNQKQTGVSLGGRIGCIVERKIEGRSKIDYAITGIKASKVEKKVYLKFLLNNSGNVLLKPDASLLVIQNKTNDVVLQQKISDISVLPKNSQEVKTFFKLDREYSKTDLSAILSLDFGEDNLFYKEVQVK